MWPVHPLAFRTKTVVIRHGALNGAKDSPPLREVVAFVLPGRFHCHGGHRSFLPQHICRTYRSKPSPAVLKSHAGLYAAPRVIEKGARLSEEQLAATLQRAGYAQDQASNIWNGSFKVTMAKSGSCLDKEPIVTSGSV